MAADKKGKSKVDDELVASIKKLQDIQEELEKINEEEREKIEEIEQKYNVKRRPAYLKRNEILKSVNIPINSFWMAAFCNHPTLSKHLTEEDQKIFEYLDSLDVDDCSNPKSGYSITFTFKENPYFENTKLTKYVSFADDGATNVAATVINWKEGMGPLALDQECGETGNKQPLDFKSFFTWFQNREDLSCDQVAEIIKEDLWPNPLNYFDDEIEDDSDFELYIDEESDDDDDDDDDVDDDDEYKDEGGSN